jgi:hypothetical protein
LTILDILFSNETIDLCRHNDKAWSLLLFAGDRPEGAATLGLPVCIHFCKARIKRDFL